MKKIILSVLIATMLFTVVPNKAVAAEECKHTNIMNGRSYFWVNTGQGFSHPYLIANGISAGCDVNIERLYYNEICPTCHAATLNVPTDQYRENHEIKSHNTW